MKREKRRPRSRSASSSSSSVSLSLSLLFSFSLGSRVLKETAGLRRTASASPSREVSVFSSAPTFHCSPIRHLLSFTIYLELPYSSSSSSPSVLSPPTGHLRMLCSSSSSLQFSDSLSLALASVFFASSCRLMRKTRRSGDSAAEWESSGHSESSAVLLSLLLSDLSIALVSSCCPPAFVRRLS